MKSKLAILASVFALALALAPSASAQPPQPVYTSPPQITDTETLIRQAANGTTISPTFSLGQEFNLAFSLISFPQGGQSASLNTTTSTLTITPTLFTSPLPALGYATGLGAGLSITQLTNKTTAVTFPTPTWTGTITTNNAGLNTVTAVQFTVNDSAVWNTDTVILTQANNPTHTYGLTAIAQNGSFVVTLYNESGGTLSDALAINFVVVRGSNN
jgi:hypothetical protein